MNEIKEKKGSKEYIKKKLLSTISELVYDKSSMRKAYNYYHGKLDRDQFKHIEENYGVGMPTSITFIPLIKKHIDVLVGEFVDMPLNIKVSCKDEKTVSNVFIEKQNAILSALKYKILGGISDTIDSIFGNSGMSPTKISSNDLEKLKEDVANNFISSYEIAAQNIIEYLLQSKQIDARTKLVKMLTDFLISGTMYYKTLPTEDGENIELEALNPMNTFVERNPNSVYLKDSPRCVCKYFYTVDTILNKYKKHLSDEDIEKLTSSTQSGNYNSNSFILRTSGDVKGHYNSGDTGIIAGLEVIPVNADNEFVNNSNYLQVYEVEYLETDKDGIMHKYSGVKITDDIVIIYEVDKDVFRNKNNKSKCNISVNGLFMTTRDNKPFSLIEATMDLQDQYNLLFYYKNATIATSGGKGDWIDFSMIPEWLGTDDTERLLKFLAYKKQGIAMIDTSQVGEGGGAPLNTTFGGYDDSVNYNAIQAIEAAIMSVEQTVSSITGVTREKLGMIEQRDAVSNVKVGISQSTTITKMYFYNMRLISKEIMLDMLDLAKSVYKKGLTGMIILGDAQKEIFTALPDKYTMTDFDIHIMDGEEAVKDMDLIRQLVFELIKGQQIDAEVAIESIGCKSLTELKTDVLSSVKEKSKQMDQSQQMQQQLEQLSQQMQQLQAENDELKKVNQKLQKDVENVPIDDSNSIDAWKARKDIEIKEKELELKKTQLQYEVMQMNDNNPHNNEIRNV